MRDFIKKIWSGQISPAEDWMTETEEIKEIERIRARHKESLIKVLGDDGAETLEKFIECDNEIEWIHNEEAFICGVRFAVQFLVQALG